MKTKIYDMNGSGKDFDLPSVFSTDYRPDLIKRAVLALQSAHRQPYGLDVLAGRRTSAHYHGSRHYRFSMMNKEMARIARIHGKSAGGTYLAFRARFVSQATKGIRAHGPKPEKIWLQKINKKEQLLSLRSAIAATTRSDLIRERGHRFEGIVPIIVDNDFENINKAKQFADILNKIGLTADIERCAIKKVRAGKGKMRGRKYKKKKGILFVFSKKCNGMRAAKNIAGADVIDVDTLAEDMNVELFAPGCVAGRMAVFTKDAVSLLNDKLKR